MNEVETKLEKTITKTFFGCVKCLKKMESITIGGSDGGMFAGFGSSSTKAMYCDNRECERYGLLTVAGIRTQE